MKYLHILLILCSLAGFRVGAQSPTLRVFAFPQTIPERGVVQSWAVLFGGQRFTFFPPLGWHMDANSALSRVTLTSPDLISSITCKFTSIPAGTETNKLDKQLLARYPGGRVNQQIDCYCLGQKCPAFDMDVHSPRFGLVSRRIALVPFEGGTIEIAMTPGSTSMDKLNFIFGNMLGSFQVQSGDPPNAAEAGSGK